MDKVLILSAVLFGMSTVLGFSSLLYTDWLNSGKDLGGQRMGLFYQCSSADDNACHLHQQLLPEWNLSMSFLMLAVMLIGVTFVFVVGSYWKRSLLTHARRLAFIATGCLCVVGVLFPFGFRHPEIGGSPFNLPAVWHVGNSYKILWLSALIFTTLGWSALVVQLRVWIVAV